MKINHKFVKYIPDHLVKGVIYISIEFSTAVHKCCCGCDEEVITPFSPTDWEINYNGKTVSLYPSIGNWSFKCQSHYWIRHSEIIWSRKWSLKEVEKNRRQDMLKKRVYYQNKILNSFHKDKKKGFIYWLIANVKNLFLKQPRRKPHIKK